SLRSPFRLILNRALSPTDTCCLFPSRGNRLTTTKSVHEHQPTKSPLRLPGILFSGAAKPPVHRLRVPGLNLRTRRTLGQGWNTALPHHTSLPPLQSSYSRREKRHTPISSEALPSSPESRFFFFKATTHHYHCHNTLLCRNTQTRSALNPHRCRFSSSCFARPSHPAFAANNHYHHQHTTTHSTPHPLPPRLFFSTTRPRRLSKESHYRPFRPNSIRPLNPRPARAHCMSGTEAPKVKQSK
ncbi:hypothetical protein CH063_07059, partial [Colletotrichum higginsianum]